MQNALDPLRSGQMSESLDPADELVFIEIRGISTFGACLDIAGRAVKTEAQHAEPLDRDIASLWLHHPDGKVGVAPMQVHGMDIGDDLDPQTGMPRKQRWQ